MSHPSKRIVTLLILLIPILIAGILAKNIALDILPVMAIAAFSCWAVIRFNLNKRETL